MPLPMLIVDAFVTRGTPFSGNPAAVCLLDRERTDAWQQSVAAEMNLSETAFLLRGPQPNVFRLRWFTPKVEVSLCGHATLASAHTLWEQRAVAEGAEIVFQTKSGPLTARRRNDVIVLDFPLHPPERAEIPESALDALGVSAVFTGKSRLDYLVEVASADVLRAIQPDFAALAAHVPRGLIVTSRSDESEYDFISRFFAPAAGVNEDPVTGSAHCCLAAYWRDRLGRDEMVGYQASARGGVIRVKVAGDRVLLGGRAVTVVRGELVVA
jgi:PhzF family phenazine biosynthesis protein